MIIIETEKDAEKAISYFNSFGEFTKYPHSTNMYGIGYWLKKRFRIPQFVCLDNWETLHGPPISNLLEPEHIHSKIHFFLYNNVQYKNYKKAKKKGIIVGSSFVHCKEVNNIVRLDSANGTIAFPVHSTFEVNLIFNWDDYAKSLLNLPAQFQPVSVSLYYLEIQSGIYKYFLKNGIKVYCAGHMKDHNFPLNFYHILQKFKYSTSNMIGSYAYYSIEFDIPFFLYGNAPSIYNHGNGEDFIKEKQVHFLHESMRHYEFFKKEINMTTFDVNSQITISKELKSYIDIKLGNTDRYNIIKIHFYIWKRYIRFLLGRLILGRSN